MEIEQVFLIDFGHQMIMISWIAVFTTWWQHECMHYTTWHYMYQLEYGIYNLSNLTRNRKWSMLASVYWDICKYLVHFHACLQPFPANAKERTTITVHFICIFIIFYLHIAIQTSVISWLYLKTQYQIVSQNATLNDTFIKNLKIDVIYSHD